MSDTALLTRQVGYEQRTFWRNPAAAVFTIAFPVVFLVVFGSLNRDAMPTVGGRKIAYDDYYVPALAAYGLMTACFTNLAMTLAIRRDAGLLKRMRGTPLPTWAFISGLIISALIISVILVVFTIVFGMVVYGVQAPHHPAAVALVFVVGAVTFCALGMAISAVIPNADAAPAIVNLPLFILLFISGTFFPIDPRSVLARIADYFPVRHFITGAFTAFDPAQTSSTGVDGIDLLVMLAWAAGALFVVARRFRWEPRRS